MTVRVLPVDVLAAEARVDLHVVVATGMAAVRDVRRLDAAENRVEVMVADVKTEVVTLESLSIGEVESQRLVDVHGREIALRRLPGYAEQAGQGLCCVESVVGRNDHVVEPDAHGEPSPGAASARIVSETRRPSSPGEAQEIVAEAAIAVAHVDDSHHEAPVAGVNAVGAGRVTPSIDVPEGRV